MILLGLGSNLGDRQANLEAALRALGHGDDAPLRLLRVSSVYESAALLPEDAPEEWNIAYYNIVAVAETTLSPDALLEAAQRIEIALGRKDVGRWGPRLIDVDLLACDDTQLESEALTLPHREMLNRDFVMVPLAEIAPHWRHAVVDTTAYEVVQSKGMGIGEGLMRTTITLNWQVR